MVERWKGPGFVSLLISRQHLSAARCLFQVLTGSSSVKPNICEEISPGRYQRLDLFMKVLRVLCPDLTDDSLITAPKSLGIICEHLQEPAAVNLFFL